MKIRAGFRKEQERSGCLPGKLLRSHALDNECKVSRRNLQIPEPERGTPVRLALDEGKRFDQRLYRGLAALDEMHVDTIRLEVSRHLDLIHLTGLDRASRRKGL